MLHDRACRAGDFNAVIMKYQTQKLIATLSLIVFQDGSARRKYGCYDAIAALVQIIKQCAAISRQVYVSSTDTFLVT